MLITCRYNVCDRMYECDYDELLMGKMYDSTGFFDGILNFSDMFVAWILNLKINCKMVTLHLIKNSENFDFNASHPTE